MLGFLLAASPFFIFGLTNFLLRLASIQLKRTHLCMEQDVESRIVTLCSKKVKSLLLVHDEAGGAGRQMNTGKSLLEQFQGSDGRQHLIDALVSQPLVGDRDLAVIVAQRLKLEEVPAGKNLIKQGASDTDLFLILKGAVSIAVDGREVAHKEAGEHVGEMAVVDPVTPRSASVVTTADTVVARIAEPDFSALADRHPRLWRRIALELASRLRTVSTVEHHKSTVEHHSVKPHHRAASGTLIAFSSRRVRRRCAANPRALSARARGWRASGRPSGTSRNSWFRCWHSGC